MSQLSRWVIFALSALFLFRFGFVLLRELAGLVVVILRWGAAALGATRGTPLGAIVAVIALAWLLRMWFRRSKGP